jgi:hypothetical protein
VLACDYNIKEEMDEEDVTWKKMPRKRNLKEHIMKTSTIASAGEPTGIWLRRSLPKTASHTIL